MNSKYQSIFNNNSQNKRMAQNKQESLFRRFLTVIDVFSYVPVPQAYPVSTNKSKIGSVLFLCVLLGYLIFDFYKFIANNIPTLNSYVESTVNNGYITLPQIAFGLYYIDQHTDNTYMFYNDSYISFGFETVHMNAFPKQNEGIWTYVTIPLVKCSEDSWASQYYMNLTCLDLSPTTLKALNISFQVANGEGQLLLQNPFYKQNSVSLMQQLLSIYWCDYSTFEITCATPQQINYVLSRSNFYMIVKQPLGYDYRSGSPIQKDNVQIYTFQPLKVGYFQQQANTVQSTKFIISPNLLTTFTTKERQYSKIVQGKNKNTNIGNLQFTRLAEITFTSSFAMSVIEIHYQTLIDRVSQWSALASLVFMVAALCFLGYNKNKFNKRNPDWERFDQMLKQKLVFEMQPMRKIDQNKKKNDEISQDCQNKIENIAKQIKKKNQKEQLQQFHLDQYRFY